MKAKLYVKYPVNYPLLYFGAIDNTKKKIKTGTIGILEDEVTTKTCTPNPTESYHWVSPNIEFNYALSIKPNPILRQGLVVEYLFAEGTGTTLKDYSNKGYNMTLYGNPVWGVLTNGKYYVELDGEDDYGKVDTFTETFTKIVIELVIWLEERAGPRVLGTNIDAGAWYGKDGFLCWVNATPALSFAIASGGVQYALNSNVKNPFEKFFHFIGVYDGNKLMIYYNALKITEKVIGSVTMNINTTLQITTIASSAWVMKGKIALTRIWNQDIFTALDSVGLSIDDFVKTLYSLAKLVVPELG